MSICTSSALGALRSRLNAQGGLWGSGRRKQVWWSWRAFDGWVRADEALFTLSNEYGARLWQPWHAPRMTMAEKLARVMHALPMHAHRAAIDAGACVMPSTALSPEDEGGLPLDLHRARHLPR